MALYEYRCRACGTTFDVRRPMAKADEATPCPAGHMTTTRLLSVFAAVGSGAATASAASEGAASEGAASTGVACGAHCACHPG